MKAPEELARVFHGAGVDPAKPIVASCGTGVTASVLALALHRVAPASQVKDTTCMTQRHLHNSLQYCAYHTVTDQEEAERNTYIIWYNFTVPH